MFAWKNLTPHYEIGIRQHHGSRFTHVVIPAKINAKQYSVILHWTYDGIDRQICCYLGMADYLGRDESPSSHDSDEPVFISVGKPARLEMAA